MTETTGGGPVVGVERTSTRRSGPRARGCPRRDGRCGSPQRGGQGPPLGVTCRFVVFAGRCFGHHLAIMRQGSRRRGPASRAARPWLIRRSADRRRRLRPRTTTLARPLDHRRVRATMSAWARVRTMRADRREILAWKKTRSGSSSPQVSCSMRSGSSSSGCAGRNPTARESRVSHDDRVRIDAVAWRWFSRRASPGPRRAVARLRIWPR